MASYRKRGNRWEVSLCVNGVRESTTRETKAAAQAWAREREATLLGEKRGAIRRTVAQMVDRYMDEVSSAKRGHRWEALRAPKIVAALGTRQVAEVTASDIAAYRDARLREVSSATVQREMVLVSHMFSVAWKEWRWRADNPCAAVRKPRSAPPRERVWEPDQVRAVCGALHADLLVPAREWQPAARVSRGFEVGVVFLIALETGMRSGEILALRKGDIDLGVSVAYIRMSKTGRPRAVPLPPTACDIFRAAMSFHMGDRVFTVSDQTRDTVFRRAMKSAGVVGMTFHDARHTAVTRMARVLSPLELARVTGHADLKMLLVYYNESAQVLAEKLARG